MEEPRNTMPQKNPYFYCARPPSKPGVAEALLKQLYKTRLCPYYLSGFCRKGSNCTYAHSGSELKTPPDLSKTKICPLWQRGKCLNDNCRFAHGCMELRCTTIPPVSSQIRTCNSCIRCSSRERYETRIIRNGLSSDIWSDYKTKVPIRSLSPLLSHPSSFSKSCLSELTDTNNSFVFENKNANEQSNILPNEYKNEANSLLLDETVGFWDGKFLDFMDSNDTDNTKNNIKDDYGETTQYLNQHRDMIRASYQNLSNPQTSLSSSTFAINEGQTGEEETDIERTVNFDSPVISGGHYLTSGNGMLSNDSDHHFGVLNSTKGCSNNNSLANTADLPFNFKAIFYPQCFNSSKNSSQCFSKEQHLFIACNMDDSNQQVPSLDFERGDNSLKVDQFLNEVQQGHSNIHNQKNIVSQNFKNNTKQNERKSSITVQNCNNDQTLNNSSSVAAYQSFSNFSEHQSLTSKQVFNDIQNTYRNDPSNTLESNVDQNLNNIQNGTMVVSLNNQQSNPNTMSGRNLNNNVKTIDSSQGFIKNNQILRNDVWDSGSTIGDPLILLSHQVTTDDDTVRKHFQKQHNSYTTSEQNNNFGYMQDLCHIKNSLLINNDQRVYCEDNECYVPTNCDTKIDSEEICSKEVSNFLPEQFNSVSHQETATTSDCSFLSRSNDKQNENLQFLDLFGLVAKEGVLRNVTCDEVAF